MSANMQAALTLLNKATERTYTIRQEGTQFVLSMPLGGSYPPVTAHEMVVRLVILANAAKGRTS